MAKGTHYKAGIIGTAVLAAYIGLAGSPFFPRPAYADNRKCLESEVQGVHHGIKDGRYYAEATVSVRNNCADITEELTWSYSLCFETSYREGENGIMGWFYSLFRVPEGKVKKSFQCVDGKTEMLKGLRHDEEQKRKALLKMRGEDLTIDFYFGDKKKTIPIRGQKPKITVHLAGSKPRKLLYERNHYLPPVGDY